MRSINVRKEGQAAVEFALVLLVLLAVLYGIMEIGRLLLINAELENAAREATNYAALHPGVDENCLRTRAINPKLTLVDRNSPDLTVVRTFPNPPDSTRCGGIAQYCPIKVSVTYSWSSMVNFMPDMSTLSLRPLGPLSLEGSSMRLMEVGNNSSTCP
jgi:hypothetical protein